MTDTPLPNEDDVLRRMLATPARPHKLEKSRARPKIGKIGEAEPPRDR